jgi:hypothetical protein
MGRFILSSGAVIVCSMMLFTGCDTGTGPSEPSGNENRNVIFSEGFESDLSAWEGLYMVSDQEKYHQMRITADAAHSGKNSLTTDSNMTALYHVEDKRVETGTVGIEFYMMATTLEQANFGVEIGQNPGSSGKVSPSFGIYFDPSDSIKCTFFTAWPVVDRQTIVAPIQAGQWYKCQVEVNFEDSTVSYFIDDILKHTEPIVAENYFGGIERLLVYRGKYGKIPLDSEEGVKPYYIDDITFYTPKTAE